MSRGPNFIEKEVFLEMLAEVPRKDGAAYQDVHTAYSDMSRLVVGWLARATPQELKELYNEYGWKSTPNARQIHLTARHWLNKFHPELSVAD